MSDYAAQSAPLPDEQGHKPDPDLLALHPCPCDKECPCDLLAAWVSVDKKLTAANETVAKYEEWLSNGVYFTEAEYLAEVAETNRLLAAANAENQHLRLELKVEQGR